MRYFSMGMALFRQWFPEVEPEATEGARPQELLAVELDGTVGIVRASGDRIEASIAGRIRAQAPNGALGCAEDDDAHHSSWVNPGPLRAEARLEARSCSSAALAEADPFVWLELLDDRGVPLTHEMFLGCGVGVEYKVHARIEMPTLVVEPIAVESDDCVRAPRRSPSRTRLASGLHARVVTRTYRNSAGPRYHTETLVLTLLAAGADLSLPVFSMMPPFALATVLPGIPARVAQAEARRPECALAAAGGPDSGNGGTVVEGEWGKWGGR